MTKKPVYLILGVPSSGRREVIADLVTDTLTGEGIALTLLSGAEQESEIDKHLGIVAYFDWTSEHRFVAEIPDACDMVFVVTDGRHNPVDQIEAFRDWLPGSGCELARIFCVVNCQLAEKTPEIVAWYDACIHFSDVVFLNRREGVSNKWISDFVDRYEKQCMPCLFEMVRGGRVKNPALILEPVARRISQAFDDQTTYDLGDIVVEDEEGNEDEEFKAEKEEDEALSPKIDPYFVRRPGGRRLKEIPDIAAILKL
jgi:hypothetical protein